MTKTQTTKATEETEETCEHPRMAHPDSADAGTCLECGEVCTCDDHEQPWAGDDDCPIHGQ